jgi:hypothetical protein
MKLNMLSTKSADEGNFSSPNFGVIKYSTAENKELNNDFLKASESKNYNIEAKCDRLRLFYNNIPKNTLLYLLQNYGEDITGQILHLGEVKKLNVDLGDRATPLLKSQIMYEILYRDLKYPSDFLLKRHNYLSVIQKTNLMISFLCTFCDVAEKSIDEFKLELVKLLAFKYYLNI